VPSAPAAVIESTIEDVNYLAHELVHAVEDLKVLRVDDAAGQVQRANELASESEDWNVLRVEDIDFKLAQWTTDNAFKALASFNHVEKWRQLRDN